MVLTHACTLESPGGLLKILVPGPHPPEVLVLLVWGGATALVMFLSSPSNSDLQPGSIFFTLILKIKNATRQAE